MYFCVVGVWFEVVAAVVVFVNIVRYASGQLCTKLVDTQVCAPRLISIPCATPPHPL